MPVADRLRQRQQKFIIQQFFVEQQFFELKFVLILVEQQLLFVEFQFFQLIIQLKQFVVEQLKFQLQQRRSDRDARDYDSTASTHRCRLWRQFFTLGRGDRLEPRVPVETGQYCHNWGHQFDLHEDGHDCGHGRQLHCSRHECRRLRH